MPDSKLGVCSLPKNNINKGFTLIEILVSIAILAMAALVAIPNLHRFNDDQVLSSAISDMVNTLKIAQANSQSGVFCPTDKSFEDFWAVSIQSNGYYLWSYCSSSTTKIQPAAQKFIALPTKLSISTPYILAPPAYPPSSCAITPSSSGITISGSTASCPCFLGFKNNSVYSAGDKNTASNVGGCYKNTSYAVYDTTLSDPSDPNYGKFTITIKQQGNANPYKCIQVNKGGAIYQYDQTAGSC